MLSKQKGSSSSSTGGLFVKVTLGDVKGRVFMNALGIMNLEYLLCLIFLKSVWVNSFTAADELQQAEILKRGTVVFTL